MEPAPAPRVPAGARLTLTSGALRVPVRALGDSVPDTGRWAESVAVLATAQVRDLDGADDVWAELVTPGGLVSMTARVVSGPLGTLLRLGPDARPVQRRDAVRGAVELEVLLAVPDVATPTYGGRLLAGRTLNISAGGILATLEAAPEGLRGPGATVTAELTLPGDQRVTTVLEVLEVHGSTVRAAFAAIEPTAQQRLVGLVFARERALLRERRSEADHAATGGRPGPVPDGGDRTGRSEPRLTTDGGQDLSAPHPADEGRLAEVRPLIARRPRR